MCLYNEDNTAWSHTSQWCCKEKQDNAYKAFAESSKEAETEDIMHS